MKTLSQLLNIEDVLDCKIPMDSGIQRVTADSKLGAPGTLFVAIRGTKVDGHHFVPQAIELGATVLVDRPEVHATATRSVLVRSTRMLLGKVMSRFYDEPSAQFSLVGVTGTNGKTTVSFLMDQVWQGMGLKTGLIGTVENRIGNVVYPSQLTTPGPAELQGLFYEMAKQKVAVAMMEVTSIALDQFRVNGSHFKVGIFTNFSLDHLDYHGNMENYLEAKLKLFRDYDLKAAVINADDAVAAQLLSVATSSTKIKISLKNPEADFYASNIEYTKSGTIVKLQTPLGIFTLQTPFIGQHNVYNVLNVLGAIHALGMDLGVALRILKTAPGAPGRLERVLFDPKYPHIFVDYAHTDDALKNVLVTLMSLNRNGGSNSGRIITVFGCGGDRDRSKRSKMGAVVAEFSDVAIATSDNPRTEDPNRILDDIEVGLQGISTEYYRESDRRRAIHLALKLAGPQDIVLVAGKGHETYQILGTQKIDFDDRNVIRGYYAAPKGAV